MIVSYGNVQRGLLLEYVAQIYKIKQKEFVLRGNGCPTLYIYIMPEIEC